MASSRLPLPLRLLLPFAAFLLATYFLASFLFTLFASYFPGPYYDYWVDMAKVGKFFEDPASLTLKEMLAAHNEAHRIFIPRLLFILDYLLAHGSNLFLISVSLSCKLGTLWLFNHQLRRENAMTRLLLNTVFIAGLSSVGNVSNILMSSNVQWDLMLLFSFLSLHFFLHAADSGRHLILALLCLVASFLSHGASLAIPFVFLLLSFAQHNRRLVQISAGCAFLFIALHFYLLPAWTGENVVEESGLPRQVSPGYLLLWLIQLVIFVLHFLFAPVRHLGIGGVYFSFFFLLLLILCLRTEWTSKKAQRGPPDFFLGAAVFLGLATLLIASARVANSPRFYWASQYEPIAIMFLVCTTAASWRLLATRTLWRNLAIAHCLFMLVWNQFQPYPYAIPRANRALDSHTYMFMFDRDQYQGDALKIWVMDPDPVKAIDPLFASRSFAYYHNKQSGQGRYANFVPAGQPLLTLEEMNDFATRCRRNPQPVTYTQGQFGKINLSTPIDLAQTPYWQATLHRDSYYVLDATGMVIGFAYTHLPPQQLWPRPELRGLLNSASARYVAEIRNSRAVCRYDLAPPH